MRFRLVEIEPDVVGKSFGKPARSFAIPALDNVEKLVYRAADIRGVAVDPLAVQGHAVPRRIRRAADPLLEAESDFPARAPAFRREHLDQLRIPFADKRCKILPGPYGKFGGASRVEDVFEL